MSLFRRSIKTKRETASRSFADGVRSPFKLKSGGAVGARHVVLLAIGLFAFGVACDLTAPPVPVASVVITPTTPVDLVPGGTDVLLATPKDAGGAPLNNRITEWSSSDPTKVTVAAGVVTGVALGTATITATIEGHSATTDVAVKEGKVCTIADCSFSAENSVVAVSIPAGALAQTRNITVSPATNPPANNRLMPGTAFQFGPEGVTFAQPVAITIKYDPSTLTAGSPESGLQLYEVIGTGWRVVAGSTVNTTTKTVTGNVAHMAVYGVLMQPRVESITINPDATVQVQTTLQFTATLKDNEQQPLNRPVTWSSSAPGILTIDANGLASALIPGQSTVTATSEGKSATAVVTVVPGPAQKLVIAAGDGQTAVAGGAIATPPAVKVTDAFGNPVSGFAITYAVATGGGTITGASATTSASGIAAVGSWTLGAVAGPNTLTATGTGLTPGSVTFTATGGAGAATTLVPFAGNKQTGTAGGKIANSPSVRINDANGNPVAGYTVVYTPGAGSGSVTGGSAVTDASGIAAPTSWILGTTPGEQTLTATASGLSGSPFTFTATAVAPVAARILLNNGDGQSAPTGKPVPLPPSVKVVDVADIGVPGVAVTFAVTGGGGSIVPGDAVTNINGFAQVGSWILGPTAGTNTLTATSGSLTGSPVTFTATGISLPPVAMAISAGNGQSAPAGTPVPINPAVKVTDANGAGVSGVTVTFSLKTGAGSITGATPVTNSSGIATLGSWTLGSGGNSLLATVNGLIGSPLTFVASGTVQVQVVTFGDSNTDLGFAGNNPTVKASSYVSNAASTRLDPGAPNSSFQLAGKIETGWRSVRSQTIAVVNHGIAGTTTGTGRTILGSPNARETVNGVARFQGEVLGFAYAWNGNEPVGNTFPNGGILRVQAFTPRTSDFVYISIGTNDTNPDVNLSTAASLANLEWMIDQWTSLGLPVSHVIITTLPPKLVGQSGGIPPLNNGIRALAASKGAKLIDITLMTSNDNGLTWKSPSLHVGDFLHYAESVRDTIAANVISIMAQQTP